MLRRLSGVHMPDELRVEVRIGGDAGAAVRAECEQSLFRIAGEALFNIAVHADATPGGGAAGLRRRPGPADDLRRRLRASRGGAAQPAGGERRLPVDGEHRGLVNMAARARELGGTLAFRRARLGGLQVQVRHPDAGARREHEGGGAMSDGPEGDGTGNAAPKGRRDRGRRPRPMPTRIVLVDDHAIMRQGLRAVLEREADLHVVGEAATPAEAVAAVAAARPHVVLLDLKLTAGPQTDGLDAVPPAVRGPPGHRGAGADDVRSTTGWCVEAVQAGARGYVVKDVDTTELVRADPGGLARGERVRRAQRRRRWCGRSRAACRSARRLTDRELDVLRLLARGLSNREIGARALHLRDDGEVPRRQPHAQADGVAPRGGGVRGDEAGPAVEPRRSARPTLRPHADLRRAARPRAAAAARRRRACSPGSTSSCSSRRPRATSCSSCRARRGRLIGAGDAIRGAFDNAAATASGVPFVGDDLARALGTGSTAGDSLSSSGREIAATAATAGDGRPGRRRPARGDPGRRGVAHAARAVGAGRRVRTDRAGRGSRPARAAGPHPPPDPAAARGDARARRGLARRRPGGGRRAGRGGAGRARAALRRVRS